MAKKPKTTPTDDTSPKKETLTITPPPVTPDEQLAQIRRDVAQLSKRLGWR